MDELNERFYARLSIKLIPSIKQFRDVINDNSLSPKTRILILKKLKKELEEEMKISYLVMVSDFFMKNELDKKPVVSYRKSFLPEHLNFVITYSLN